MRLVRFSRKWHVLDMNNGRLHGRSRAICGCVGLPVKRKYGQDPDCGLCLPILARRELATLESGRGVWKRLKNPDAMAQSQMWARHLDGMNIAHRLSMVLGAPFVRYLAGRGFDSRDILLGLSAAFGTQLTDALLISMGPSFAKATEG